MPPLPDTQDALPRVIVYHQTHHDPSGKPISALPLIGSGVSHVYIAAIHLNDPPENITLNDHHPDVERNAHLWDEVKQLQDAGIKVMAMLGGAAKGSYEKLERDFEAHYTPLRALLSAKNLNGLDLDIEEPTSLALTTKLLTRLHSDFGPSFLLTLAPVMPALLPAKEYLTQFCYRLLHPELPNPGPLVSAFVKAHLLPSRAHMSGFNHFELEASEAGGLVSWYNVQMYCGWGDAGDPRWYEAIIASGFNPRRVVLGAVSNPGNGSGYVPLSRLLRCLKTLRDKYGDEFGGVMGWEYFNAGETTRPEDWVGAVARELGRETNFTGEVTERPPSGDEMARALALLNSVQVPGAAEADEPTSPPAVATTASASQPPSDAEHEAKVQQLVAMGFDRVEASNALEAMGGDVEAAASILS